MLRTAVAVALAAIAAGCRIEGLAEPQHTGAVADRAPREQPLPVLSGPDGTGVAPAETAKSRPSVPPPETVPAQQASLDIGPDRVLGLDRRAVATLLGEPDFVRRENPMELWRYRHEGCAVALFLYAEEPGGGGPFRVRHIEAWAPGDEQISPRACLSALAKRAGQSASG